MDGAEGQALLIAVESEQFSESVVAADIGGPPVGSRDGSIECCVRVRKQLRGNRCRGFVSVRFLSALAAS